MVTLKQLKEVGVKHALAQARRGRPHALAELMRHAGVHAEVVAWIEDGAPTERRRGKPRRDLAISRDLISVYRDHRETIPPEYLPEKAIELWLCERFGINVRDIRAIVKTDHDERERTLAQHLGVPTPDARAYLAALRKQRWDRWRRACARAVARSAGQPLRVVMAMSHRDIAKRWLALRTQEQK